MDEPTRTRLGESRDQMKQAASSAAGTARHQARDRAEGLRHSVLATADHVADALDAAAGSLKGSEPWLGSATEDLSRQVRRVTERGRDRSLGELRRDLESVARENPAAFMTGALALGLGIGRFLKSAPPEQRTRHAEPATGTTPRPAPTATPTPTPGGSATTPSSPTTPQGGHHA